MATETKFAGAGANVGAQAMSWTTPGNIISDNAAEATILAYDSDELEKTLRSSSHGFAIPGGATINGIEAFVGRRNSTGGGLVVDNVIQLVKAGTPVGTNKSAAVAWPTAEAEASYGGAADLWGTTWTDTEINATGFGLDINPLNSGSSQNAQVDYVKITVHYTASGSDTLFAQSVM